jgi:hypothetical protein
VSLEQSLAIRVSRLEVLEEALHQAPTLDADEFLVRLDRVARELSSDDKAKLNYVHLLSDNAINTGINLAPVWRQLCEAKAASYQRLVRATRRDGLWALRYGAFAFIGALSISIILDQSEVLPKPLSRPIVEGFVIASWVSLWRPLELLLYEWLPFGRMSRTFDLLATLPVRVAAVDDAEPTQR